MESEPHCRVVMSSVRPFCDRRKDIYSYILVHILPEQQLPSATKLRRLCFYRCLSVHGGGVTSQHALQVVSQHALQQVSRGGGIPACLADFQAHIQGGSLGGSGRGVSRPTPKGEVEGDLVQAHSQGGS